MDIHRGSLSIDGITPDGRSARLTDRPACHAGRMRQVTVLGSCGAFPEPGRACSGFAVDWDGYRLVLDLGYATLPRLLTHWPDGAVDAVAITHEHPDHCIDLHGLFDLPFWVAGAPCPLPS